MLSNIFKNILCMYPSLTSGNYHVDGIDSSGQEGKNGSLNTLDNLLL